ncbi:MAG: hypothetical protein K8T25_05100 [Planctomycetia bacterium]|nr:hypothetical protein [Planctomycetia bacterium]
MFAPQPALVRPRISVPDVAGSQLLHDEVQLRIDAQRPGLIELDGPPGCGKRAALADLAFRFADHPFLVFADRPTATELESLWTISSLRLVIYVSNGIRPQRNDDFERWRIAPWTRDECIEYLLAATRHNARR